MEVVKFMKTLSFGPLLGDVTSSTAKVWGALADGITDLDKADFGRIRFRELGNAAWSKTYSFRFNAGFQYTGVVQLCGLKPATQYEYQVGYSAEASAFDWPDEHPKHVFSTTTLWQWGESFHFALGSCLYPRKSFVAANNSALGVDKAFRHVSHWHQQTPLSLMILMGDQIYADTGNVGEVATDMADYVGHYHRLFRGRDFAKAVSVVPTYMVMDDHEIHDKFSSGSDAFISKIPWWKRFLGLQTPKLNHQRFINGLGAYNAFQAVHSPVFDDLVQKNQHIAFVKGQRGSDIPDCYYYVKNYGDCSFFFLDTRLERTHNDIISDTQCAALKAWLRDDPAKVKFVVSAVTFLADAKAGWFESADNWALDCKRRNQILATIVKHDIKNVFFLAGDIHASFLATLKYKGKALPVHQIACSGLHWPIGGLNGLVGNLFRWQRDNVRFGKRIKGTVRFALSQPISEQGVDYYSGNGIGRIDIEGNDLIFSVAARKDCPGQEYRLVARVPLLR